MSNNDASIQPRMTDVLIKDVYVDSTRSHGVIIRFVDRLECERETVTRGQAENTGIGGYCAWGSALRVEFGTHVKFTNCKAFHNRGEGINVANSLNALVEHCESYDNFAPNFYIIRSSKVTFRNNLSYNQDSIYWRNCEPGTGNALSEISPTAGLSIANEVAYQDFVTGDICSPYHTTQDGITLRLADSIFIYNNIFIMAPFYLIDESFGDFFCLNVHANNFSNIYLENNTFVGDLSLQHNRLNDGPMLTFIFNPNYFQGCGFSNKAAYRCENIVFKNNIVSNEKINTSNGNTIHPIYVLYGGRPCNGGTIDTKFTASNNLWHHNLPSIVDHFVSSSTTIPNFFYNNATDIVNDEMLTVCMPNDIKSLIPNSNTNANRFYKLAAVSSYITHDYSGNPRNISSSNVGALELNTTVQVDQSPNNLGVFIYPNPSKEEFHIRIEQNEITDPQITVLDIMGKVIQVPVHYTHSVLSIILSEYSNGIYFVRIETANGSYEGKLIKI